MSEWSAVSGYTTAESAGSAVILVIDDQPTTLFLLGQMLRQEFRVHVATGGQDGLEMALRALPDLILLDVSMPDIGGYEVCKRLKANPATRDIPVIFITSMNDAQNESLGLSLGAMDYIVKPFKPALVLARIKNHLRLQKTLQELAAKNHELERLMALRDRMEQISRHDLKNPLGLILNLPLFMQDIPGTTPEHMEVATLVERAGARMLAMIDHTLALHKMESGFQDFSRMPVNLTALVTEVVQEMQPWANNKHITLALAIASGETSLYCLGDEHLLYTMIANLVKNAIEASPKKQTITIRLDPQGGLHIHNHGAVPEAIRARFFEKFASHGKTNGSGLGTYSALLVANLHGGTITLCVGEEDTEIAVRLPMAASASPCSTAPTAGPDNN